MPSNAPTNPLLEEGARSYPKALQAVAEFRRQVQDICFDAMKRHLKDLGDALGLRLEANQLKPYAWPDKLDSDDLDGTCAHLGAKIEPAGAIWSLWNYVYWDKDSVGVCVSLAFTDSKLGERVQAVTEKHGTSLDPKEVYLSRPVGADGLAGLDSTLEELNREWIEVWRKVGGVKQFLGGRRD